MMMIETLVCPRGHQSSEPDYCSECGAKLTGAPQPPPIPLAAGALCPVCGAARDRSDIVFCEICGCNFADHPPAASLEPPPPFPVEESAPPASLPETPPASPLPTWTVLIAIDPGLREAGSPEPPPGMGPFTVRLTEPVSLIGRRSEARAIFPEIPLQHDDAVSHRHALLQVSAEGGLTLRDIGSSNGTRVNGQEIAPLQDHELKDGDEITLGHWSRISVQQVH